MADDSGVPVSDSRLFDFNASLMIGHDDAKAPGDLEKHGDADPPTWIPTRSAPT